MAINFYRVLFHSESAGVVLQNSFRAQNLAAANNLPGTLTAIIASNGLAIPGTVVLDSISNAEASVYLT